MKRKNLKALNVGLKSGTDGEMRLRPCLTKIPTPEVENG
jgi:hypothetical protein